jgi:hypothetical protein
MRKAEADGARAIFLPRDVPKGVPKGIARSVGLGLPVSLDRVAKLDVCKLLELRLYRVRQTEDMIDIAIEGFVVTQFDRKRAAARRTSRRALAARTRDRPQASAMGRSAQREEAVAEASFARYMKPVRFGRPDLPRPTRVSR